MAACLREPVNILEPLLLLIASCIRGNFLESLLSLASSCRRGTFGSSSTTTHPFLPRVFQLRMVDFLVCNVWTRDGFRKNFFSLPAASTQCPPRAGRIGNRFPSLPTLFPIRLFPNWRPENSNYQLNVPVLGSSSKFGRYSVLHFSHR